MNGLRYSPFSLLLIVFISVFMVLMAVSAVESTDDGGFQFRKVSELQRIQPKKPVRIKLRRTARGQYSWELSGDDAGEILRVDRELRKVLKPQEERKHRHANR